MLVPAVGIINGEDEEMDSDEEAESDTPPESPPAEHREVKKANSTPSSSTTRNHTEKV